MEIARDYDASYLEAVKRGYWKDLNERYLVSMYGTVYDKERDRIVIPYISKGYEVIKVKYNGKWRTKGVHQLVYEAFIGEIPKGYEVNHKDENKQNNVLSNIDTLMTRKENINWGSGNERRGKALSKSVIQKTLQGEIIKIWASTREIQRQLGYSHSNISECCNGKLTQSHGFIWQYEERATFTSNPFNNKTN